MQLGQAAVVARKSVIVNVSSWNSNVTVLISHARSSLRKTRKSEKWHMVLVGTQGAAQA